MKHLARFALAVAVSCAAVILFAPIDAQGSKDLELTNWDVRYAWIAENQVTVFLTVHWSGDEESGPFFLKWGIKESFLGGNPQYHYKSCAVQSLGPDKPFTTRAEDFTFAGTLECVGGLADYTEIIDETNEANNFGQKNELNRVLDGNGTRYDEIIVHNPSIAPEVLSLTAEPPVGWTITFSEEEVELDSSECVAVGVTMEAPIDFAGHEQIELVAEFMDGTPGLQTWTCHVFSEPSVSDSVVCEPEEGNPTHPPTYWYDVVLGGGGRCDFHVRVFDRHESNYLNVALPSPAWQFAVHQVGSDWWASWWNPECTDPILDAFRFQFDHMSPTTWGEWTTTTGGTSNPYLMVADVSASHEDELDGYGRRVHVPFDTTSATTSVFEGGDGLSFVPTPFTITPNPFDRTTSIRFELDRPAEVNLGVYDVQGRLVRGLAGGLHGAGQHSLAWDGRDGSGRRVAGGVYFVKLDAGGRAQTRWVVYLE